MVGTGRELRGSGDKDSQGAQESGREAVLARHKASLQRRPHASILKPLDAP